MRHLNRPSVALLASFCLATALAGHASAHWLSDLFEPVAYEELTPPAESDGPVPTPVLEDVPGDNWQSGSVLLNPPVPLEEGWLPRDGQPIPDGVTAYDLAPESVPSYREASPFWPATPDAPAVCCQQPTIHYWNHPLLAATRCYCECDQTSDLVLSVPNGCCTVEVPVCVPACCSDAPAYEAGQDWLGRVTHTYCWPCGNEVRIVQLHIGSWVVHTYNR